MPRPSLFSNGALIALVLLLILGSIAASLKFAFLGTTHSGDYDNYVLTAQYLSGEHQGASGISVAGRMLKPLYPALLAGLGVFMDFYTAAMLQSVVFYLLFIVAMFLLAREFFKEIRMAVLTVLLSAFSYPVLKYGLDIYSETGAWFVYALSLWLTLKFIQTPSVKIFVWNVALITIGFLWKEYTIVAAMIFGLAILFHSAVSVREKVLYIGSYALIFLSVQIPWQLYVLQLFDFSYVDWYLEAGADGFSYEFTLKNIVKSTAALIGVMWLLVPNGFLRLRGAPAYQRFFASVSTPVPLIGYAWGFISSRLLYVIAPPMLLVAIASIQPWSRRSQYLIVGFSCAANIGWLILSYRITL